MDEKCIKIDMSKLVFKSKEELSKMDLKEIKEYLDGLESSGIYDGYTSLYSKAYHAYLKNVVSPISDKWKEELGFYEYCEIAYGITKETIDYLLNNEGKIEKENSPHRQWTEIYKKHNLGKAFIKGIENVSKDTADVKTVKINPVEFMNKYKDDEQPNSILEKITFDKNLKTDCTVTYKFDCDGTFTIIETGIQNAITTAMSKALYLIIQKFLDKDLVIKRFSIGKVKYIFGEATLIRNYGTTGEHDVVSIPIKCEYVE